MANTALAIRDEAALMVTPEQLDLVKRTVANGSTDPELKLYLYDCQRQGVHPLDRLLHFTKRGGKYTPVTSIDLMRIRAAETGEYAGSDDAVFSGAVAAADFAASVTVWRLVQGQRVSFAATARWSEYFPGDAGGHMWKKMPHTMLAKCAEALALRKGFPRQLAGLYAKEEMDQAGEPQGYTVTAPAPTGVREKPAARLVENSGTSSTPVRHVAGTAVASASGDEPVQRAEAVPSVPNGGDLGHSDEGPDHGVDMPEGARRILRVNPGAFGAKGFVRLNAPGMGNETEYPVYNDQLKALAEQLCQDGEPCFVDYKQAASSKKWRIENLMRVPANYDPNAAIDAEIVQREGQAF